MNTLKKSLTFLLYLAALCQFSYGDLITDVCKKSGEVDFCEKTLRSDPGASKSDLKGLGEIAINLTKTSAESGHKLVKALWKKAKKDHISDQIYSTCEEVYDDAVSAVRGWAAALDSGDYATLSISASAVIADIATCDDTFDEFPQGPKEPEELHARSHEVNSLVNIVLAIAALLKG